VKVAFTIIIFISVLLFTSATQAKSVLKDTSSSRSLHITYSIPLAKLVPNYKFFIAIGRCEQPGRGKWGIAWHQKGASYPGGLGVWAPLWTEKDISARRFAISADRATPVEQMIHAQMIINKYGEYAWGCTGVALASTSVKPVSNRYLRWASMVVYNRNHPMKRTT